MEWARQRLCNGDALNTNHSPGLMTVADLDAAANRYCTVLNKVSTAARGLTYHYFLRQPSLFSCRLVLCSAISVFPVLCCHSFCCVVAPRYYMGDRFHRCRERPSKHQPYRVGEETFAKLFTDCSPACRWLTLPPEFVVNTISRLRLHNALYSHA